MSRKVKRYHTSEFMKSKINVRPAPGTVPCISILSHHAELDEDTGLWLVRTKLEIGTMQQFELLAPIETVLVPVSELNYAEKAPLAILRNITARVYRRLPTMWEELRLLDSQAGTLCLETCCTLSENQPLDAMTILQMMSSGIVQGTASIRILPFHGL